MVFFNSVIYGWEQADLSSSSVGGSDVGESAKNSLDYNDSSSDTSLGRGESNFSDVSIKFSEKLSRS